ncbi:hypothetical protein C8J56DRAFT_1037952 [Mycena floridula]|nr:hypothetical protein C8J56DRAFT_1037952 [Mycena floridula]
MALVVPPGASLEEKAKIFSKHLNARQVMEFLPLGPAEEAWLMEQIPFYIHGIQTWMYEESLESLYVVFLDHFPHHRHRDEVQPQCRNQHISVISRSLHEKCMLGAFRKAGIHDLMQMVDPRYPGDIPVDIQLDPVQLAEANPWNAANRLHAIMLNSLDSVPPFANIFDANAARAAFRAFEACSTSLSPLPSTPNTTPSGSRTTTLYVNISYDIGCALNRE